MNLTPPLDPSVLEQAFGAFRLSRLLFAVASLDLASHLVEGPQDAPSLARKTNTHEASLTSLLDALVGWGVFTRDREDRYGLTPFSRRLVPGTENAANIPFLLGWVGFPVTYDAYGDILHTLRTGESAVQGRYGAGFHRFLSEHPEMGALYDRAMGATSDSFVQCAAAYDFSNAHTLIDVGGGQGALALEILSRYPDLHAISFDLPEVIKDAQVGTHPASRRLEFMGGDAFQKVPSGGDVYMTSTVLRCFDDERCLLLLKNISAAMPAYARLAAFEMVIPAERDNLGMSMADLTARVLYGGCDRTEQQFRDLFARAGLRLRRLIPVEGTMHVLEAVPA
ncbi:MAG: methyltransferase [Syntrophothermus sp.]